ncbi:NUDIX hydrolase domain-like protein [Roridomyces roridus]|uniref:NUDIX hydrolase domain-like protein n=1 Tax=Roridomyces roridus TaxID=1738132 RepID=A0AAD7C099_9AGAR|nr:NUDIX hydrolase domain-like protein [Roridomyces roridus]
MEHEEEKLEQHQAADGQSNQDFSMTVIPTDALACLSSSSQETILRLAAHAWDPPDLSAFPKSRLAAVLILLYEEFGELRVLLTTRSKALRTHAGQTALPGGRADESDIDVVQTALREAHEEVALPLSSPHIHTVATLEPFISLHRLVVTPIIALLTDPTLISTLRASQDEVSLIFSHPLEAILDPSILLKETLAAAGTEDWIYETELHSTTDSVVAALGDATYRMHRFRSTASPVKGLTADILMHVAEVAFGRPPVYERWAEGQPRGFATYFKLLGLPQSEN